LVGGLVIGAAAGLFAVGPMVAKSAGYVVPPSAQTDGEHAEGEGGEGGGEEGGGEHGTPEGGDHGGGKEGEAVASSSHLIDNVVLNPAGSGGTRFLMLSTSIEFGDAALVEQFKARDAEVRDVVLRVMGAKTVEVLAEMANRETLRKELADSLAQLVPKKERKKAIRRIFFPQFVIQ
jgi:flagellar FliL protein